MGTERKWRSRKNGPALTLTTGGITLLGVLLRVGVSVGFGVRGETWVRVVAGVGTTVLLILLVKLGTSRGRGPLARTANWVIGTEEDEGR